MREEERRISGENKTVNKQRDQRCALHGWICTHLRCLKPLHQHGPVCLRHVMYGEKKKGKNKVREKESRSHCRFFPTYPVM